MQIALVATRPDGHWFLRQDVDLQPCPASPATQEFSTAKRAHFVSGGAGLSGYVAECGAAIIGAMTGLRPDHLENHAAYIADWLVLVRSDPRAFLSAAAKAQSAVDWLIARAGDPVNEPAPAISADHKAALHT